MNWSSSSSPAFDFLTNGSALPMYAAFLVCVVVLLVGLARERRRLGSRDGREVAPRPGRLGRLVRFGLLQRRLLRGADSGWIHLPIFWGVVVLALGSLTIMIDSYVLRPLGLGPPRGLGYKLFQGGLDLFGVTFVIGVSLAIYRRVRTRPERKPTDHRMLVLLVVLLALGISGFVLEGLRIRLDDVDEPWSFAGTVVASAIARVAPSVDGGMTVYKILWWGHVAAAFGLIAAVPFTPLRHVFTAPLNIAVSSDRLSGALTTPFNLKDLMQSGRFDVKVGADSIEDFSRRERRSLTACADAGHCQEACPAHAAGTPLSPMRLVGALRAASDKSPSAGGRAQELPDGVLSEEAIWSCTLCGACTSACPVLVDPMKSIMKLRRGLVANNRLGKERTAVLANLTQVRNPYGSNPAAREGLGAALGIRNPADHRGAGMLYWIGCSASFDSRTRKVAEATVRILDRAGIRCSVLGAEETCCGDPARRIGEEGLFQDLAIKNIETLERHGITKVLTHCAHCFNTFRNEYPALGARFEVIHHTTLIHDAIRAGSIVPRRSSAAALTLHDACYIGRFNDGLEPPRSILRSIPGTQLREMARSGEQSFCCGAGGGNYWYEVPHREKIGTLRMREAKATNAGVVTTECPFCLKMLEDAGGGAGDAETMQVRDIAEVVAESLGEVEAT